MGRFDWCNVKHLKAELAASIYNWLENWFLVPLYDPKPYIPLLDSRKN